MFVAIIIIIIIIIIIKNNSVTPPGSIIWLLATFCWSQAQMKEEGIIPGTETWYKLKRLVKKRFEKYSNKKSNAMFLRLSEITKRKKKEKMKKKKKIMKQPSNITPLCWTTSMRKNKDKEKEKIENKSKNRKKKEK